MNMGGAKVACWFHEASGHQAHTAREEFRSIVALNLLWSKPCSFIKDICTRRVCKAAKM